MLELYAIAHTSTGEYCTLVVHGTCWMIVDCQVDPGAHIRGLSMHCGLHCLCCIIILCRSRLDDWSIVAGSMVTCQQMLIVAYQGQYFTMDRSTIILP